MRGVGWLVACLERTAQEAQQARLVFEQLLLLQVGLDRAVEAFGLARERSSLLHFELGLVRVAALGNVRAHSMAYFLPLGRVGLLDAARQLLY